MFASTTEPAGSRRGLLILAGLTLGVAAVGGGSYLFSERSPNAATTSPTSTVSPETTLARVRELEARLVELESENAALKAAAAGRAPASEPMDAGDPDVIPPTLLREGPPVPYPAAARRLPRGARVVVEALVGENGRVLEARALESSVTGLGFEEAAERQVRGRLYRPATKEGAPVRVRLRVPVEFTP